MAQQASGKDKRTWRYRLALINEWRGKDVFSFSMPVWVVAVLIVLQVLMTGLFAVFVVVRTPLKAYLPGYLDVTQRAGMIEMALRLDSLERSGSLRAAYLQDLIHTMRETTQVDTIAYYDSTQVHFDAAPLPDPSDLELAFRERYEQLERYSLGAVLPVVDNPVQTFIAPVHGDLAGDTLRLLHEMSVLAPFDGTVVSADYVQGEGYRIVLQHTGDYVVVLSRLTRCLVEAGTPVAAGTALGNAGAQGREADRWMGLRLWCKGQAVNPLSLMQL